ncbi:type II toxin-antitoxin system antitoxin SocA domain-containing protein [uncultured Pleomorphomonas sp.]|uniref:Panacea domain-containing protein n=1 Tax=uncultured Pleomorphomonas sp. TaxID=442121 RepID=UPI00258A9BED|nr:type II toxin-antitoxin system antitoxin SocA domain-containing protein [uncultured Pleomorphomonas sp.]
MKSGHDGREIANFILDFCDPRGRKITNLSLQKIAFFCHAWSLINLNKPLIRHSFEAWEFGPVLPYLYREFREFDRYPITSRAKHIDPKDGTRRTVEYSFDSATTLLLESIIDFYSRISAGDLVSLSHVNGGPWDQAWNHGGIVNPGMRIEDEKIKEFYSAASPPISLQ